MDYKVCILMRGKYETDNILYCNTIDYNTNNYESLSYLIHSRFDSDRSREG